MRFARGPLLISCVAVAVVLISTLWWRFHGTEKAAEPQTTSGNTPPSTVVKNKKTTSSLTRIHAHNLLLRKGPDFHAYVRWLDGTFARTRKGENPSFDDPESFALDINSGILRANIGDIGHFLNASLTNSPLSHVALQADGDKLKLTGTVRKIVPIPIQVIAEVSPTPDNRIRVHVTKLDVLKVPVKGLLGMFKISLADLVKGSMDGVEISGSDLVLDTQKLMPPPHIRGKLTAVRIVSPDLEEVFGNAPEDVDRVEMWRNFLSLKGGVIDFGSLTMNNVDLIMIDISKDPWFDLDLVNYQTQLTAGYTRMTAQSGLQIFMPDRRDVKPAAASQDTSIEWFKNRNIPPPSQIVKAVH